MDKDAQYYNDLLLSLYDCKVPFKVEVLHTKPRTRMGLYVPKSRKIRIYDGWSIVHNCDETAIHEYAHHIHFTEFSKNKRKQAPHGREFWQIYGQLIWRAKTLGLYQEEFQPVIDFGLPAETHHRNEPTPVRIRSLLRELVMQCFAGLSRFISEADKNVRTCHSSRIYLLLEGFFGRK